MLAWHVPFLGWRRLPADLSEFEIEIEIVIQIEIEGSSAGCGRQTMSTSH